MDLEKENKRLETCLRSLLEGLECKEIDHLIKGGDPNMFRAIGEMIAIPLKAFRKMIEHTEGEKK